ncbi:uncharacterized protein [Argopecten irradians]|uniref:uncharacterized protein n=1 Tax=Argopecten irradians TaxID=31199 RepID=UPI0037235A81
MIEEYEESDDFKLRILSKFRQDVVGQLCQKDEFIKLLGRQNFKRVMNRKEKTAELREKIMSDMRRFGTLFLEFKSIADTHKQDISSSADMLSRRHFKYLQEAIENVTKCDEGKIKSGLKTGIGYLLKRAAKTLKGYCLLNHDDKSANEVDNFSTILSYFWPSMFGDAEYANVKARQLDLRRPKRLPEELQVQQLRSHVVNGISELLDPYKMLSKHDFKTLRDLLVCRLTLFNARRGGEPSRLLLKEWEDAEKEEWIPRTAVESIADPLEKQLVGKFKIAYQCGKNISQMVPLLIPNDCTNGLRVLADTDVRKSVGIDPKNHFLFPNMQSSSEHIKGWHAVQSVCNSAGLQSMITATSMRHRAATIYASLDIPENERQAFYRHMGHSEEINKNVYQCPLAIQEMTKVGRFLDNIDKQSARDDNTTEEESTGQVTNALSPNVHSRSGVRIEFIRINHQA